MNIYKIVVFLISKNWVLNNHLITEEALIGGSKNGITSAWVSLRTTRSEAESACLFLKCSFWELFISYNYNVVDRD